MKYGILYGPGYKEENGQVTRSDEPQRWKLVILLVIKLEAKKVVWFGTRLESDADPLLSCYKTADFSAKLRF